MNAFGCHGRIARAFHRLRRLVPVEWVLGYLLLVYLPTEIFLLRLQRGDWLLHPVGNASQMHTILSMVCLPRDLVVAAGMLAYGIYRIMAFHPLYSPDYGKWLQQVPWTSRRPLPLGPLHPAWQDALMVLLGLALAYDSPNLWVVPLGFLAGQMASAGRAFWTTGPWAMRYLPLFCVGLIVRFQHSPRLMLAIAVLLYLVTVLATQSALARFPWPIPEHCAPLVRILSLHPDMRPATTLGWPHDQLTPRPNGWKIALRDGIALSVLPGWLFYAAGVNITKRDDEAGLGFAYAICLIACIAVPLFRYCALRWPPISLWGRLRTFRWIIPSYDYILLPSLATAVLSPLTFATLSWSGLRLCYSIPAAMTVALAITLNTGPSLRRWQLTGAYRMISCARLSQPDTVGI
jgi:hypothetical protein